MLHRKSREKITMILPLAKSLRHPFAVVVPSHDVNAAFVNPVKNNMLFTIGYIRHYPFPVGPVPVYCQAMLHRESREGLGKHRDGERLRDHRAAVRSPALPRGVPRGGDRALGGGHRRQRLCPRHR